MRLLTVVGARPQFVKAAVVSRLVSDRADVREKVLHTGQHYDASMSEVFFRELDLPRPDYWLGVGSGSQAEQTGRMLIEIEKVLRQERPDAVLVYGDTNSTIAGALAAAKLCIPVAHIEAGLRSFDRTMPEEVNRRLTDHLSHWHFCPTKAAIGNLRNEGITQNVFRVGDVMCDALLYYSRTERLSEPLQKLLPENGPFVLCTLHRAGNTDDADRFRSLWDGINRLAEQVAVILPLHPRTRKVLDRMDLGRKAALRVIEPVGYRDMLALERRARLVVTDSGGVQKEAYMQRVPCLTLRDNTEWSETVEAGWNRLVGRNGDRLLAEARRFLENGPPREHPPFYGDGQAGRRILDKLAA